MAMSMMGYDALYETLKANADSLPLRYRRRADILKVSTNVNSAKSKTQQK